MPALCFDHGSRTHARVRGARGFSLIELALVVAVISIVAAIAIPTILGMLTNMRVNAQARLVERELQTARLRAVGTNRAIRIRFNCPGTNQFRLVEVIGTPSVPAPADDDAASATRCGLAAYPYPDANRDWFQSPNNDGPLNELDPRVEFVATQTLEFWPDGTVHTKTGAGNPWPQIPSNGTVTLQLQRKDGSSAQKTASLRQIQVNGVGKIQLQ